MTDDDGTDPKKLYRRTDPDTSKEAAESVDTARLENFVFDLIASYKDVDGCVSSQLVDRCPNMPYSSVTARYKALKDKGRITYGPDKRKLPGHRRQGVMRVKNGKA